MPASFRLTEDCRVACNSASPTLIRAITNGSPQVPQDLLNIPAEKSLSAFDRTHRFVANYIYEAPTIWFAKNNRLLRRTFGGWEISGIVTRQSGQPFSILTGVDSNGNGAGGDQPTFAAGGLHERGQWPKAVAEKRIPNCFDIGVGSRLAHHSVKRGTSVWKVLFKDQFK
jgi:hypothetical protein